MLKINSRITTAALAAAALALPATAERQQSSSYDTSTPQTKSMSPQSSGMSAQSMDPNNVDAVVVVRRVYLMNLDPGATDTSFKRAMRENQQGRAEDAARSLRQAGSQTRLEAARSTSPQDQQRLNQQAQKIEDAADSLEQGQAMSDDDLQQLSQDTNMMLSESRYNQSSSTWSGRSQADDYSVSSRYAAEDMRAAGEYRTAAGMNDETTKEMRKISRDMQTASTAEETQRDASDSAADQAKEDFDLRYRRQLTRRPSTTEPAASTGLATPETDREMRATSDLDTDSDTEFDLDLDEPEVGQDAEMQGLNDGDASNDPYGGTATDEGILPATGTQ